MVDFLIKRPIAVIMAFLALVIIGCVTFSTLPVSLLPDVAIPHITVQVSGDNMSARELENTMVTPLRRNLLQVGGLSDIQSETRDGSAIIRLTMDYGVDTDLAFIEVNEKIDASMNSLPRTATRPKAVKASATDIPVVYLNLTPRNNANFMDMAEVAANIVRRRLEQLPEVAMVDATGIPSRQLRIVPDNDKLLSQGITAADIESLLKAHNADPGSMIVRDGYYEYNIQISNRLRTPQDVGNLQFLKNGRMHRLSDFCLVELTEADPEGFSYYNGDRAVTLALIKHDAESMAAMEKAVDNTIAYFSSQYPDIVFSKSRSQTQLLDFTISNLEQNLILGLILVFVVCALFMRSGRLPFIIGLTIVVAVIATFLLFYLFKVSINIISLAGLILAVGMMIDNSVIVAENITQYRLRGFSLEESCVKGTNEMITPMLSSSLTTVAVFVPLVFMSGIAGAIFADQAFAITAGLAASYVVGITLLPVLYYLFFKGKKAPVEKNAAPPMESSAPKSHEDEVKRKEKEELPVLIRWYDRGIDFVFSHKALSVGFVIVTIIAALPLFKVLDTERMPKIDSAETMVRIDWNENINVEENLRRSQQLTQSLGEILQESSAAVGLQDYILPGTELSSAEAEIYLRTSKPSLLNALKDSVAGFISSHYPLATFDFSAPENVFEKVFSSSEPPLQARLSFKNSDGGKVVKSAESARGDIIKATGAEVQEIPLREQINIAVRQELLALYNVDYSEVQRVIRSAFKGADVTTLRSYQDYVPVRIADTDKSIEEIMRTSLVTSRPDRTGKTSEVPLKALVSLSRAHDFKTLRAGEGGEFVPLDFDIEASEAERVMRSVRDVADATNEFDTVFTGAIFSNAKMMRELSVILLISLLMMYFILCAQFESFSQPLVVLLEIPIDITFALLSLWACGQSLNLMSAIGIIVTCGIVVNDSILKLDAINEERKAGTPLLEAIHIAGQRRLRPIIMTSLTTIFAMLPVLFTSDMGSELQRPLAIAMIGSMVVGTLVSIFIIPLVYFLIYRRYHVAA
ncbi:MAG: efflux RND transporter permease subunit [Muribaculaceae bacterium]|nr:efflux RND transporter permease subunit [Muribaculaceae bacterium]